MSAAGARLLAAVTRLVGIDGDTITITHSGAPSAVLSRISPLAPGTRYKYFTSAQAKTWAAPAFLCEMPGDYTLIAVGDAVALPSGTGDATSGYTVRGVEKPRVGDVIYKTVFFVARDAP